MRNSHNTVAKRFAVCMVISTILLMSVISFSERHYVSQATAVSGIAMDDGGGFSSVSVGLPSSAEQFSPNTVSSAISSQRAPPAVEKVLALKAEILSVSFGQDMNQYKTMITYGVNGYYLEASYNQLNMSATMTEPFYSLDHETSYYLGNEEALVKDTVLKAQSDVALLGGYLSFKHIVIIHSGFDAAMSKNPYDIHTQFRILSSPYLGVKNACIVSEYDPLGAVVHELGHSLGLPDLYDTHYAGYSTDPPFVGRWDLMGAGNWNPYPQGTSPSHPSTWCKIKLGWIAPSQIVTITETNIRVGGANATVFLNPEELSQEPLSIRVTLDNGSYFLIENRQQIGYDGALPAKGVLVLYCNDSIGSGNGPVRIVSGYAGNPGPLAALNPGGLLFSDFFGDRHTDIGVKVLNKWDNGTYKVLVGEYDRVYNTPTEYTQPTFWWLTYGIIGAIVFLFVAVIAYIKKGRQSTEKVSYEQVPIIKVA